MIIFFIWAFGEEKLREFINYNTSSNETIKFTSLHSVDKMGLLDVERCSVGKGWVLAIGLYCMLTSTYQPQYPGQTILDILPEKVTGVFCRMLMLR